MKRAFMIIFAILLCFSMSSCIEVDESNSELTSSAIEQDFSDNSVDSTANGGFVMPDADASIYYITFEEACQTANTVAVVQYVSSTPYSDGHTKHTFKTKESLLGKPDDTIYVITANVRISVWGGLDYLPYNQNDIEFEKGAEYLLILDKARDLYAPITSYSLIHEAIIRLNNVVSSTMYNTPLSDHTKDFELTETTTREEIIAYVKRLIKNNTPAYEYIDSEKIEDIVNGSEHIVKVTVDGDFNEVKNEFRHQENYACTITEVLKGDLTVGAEFKIVFFPDTVEIGEEWIVAVTPISETSKFLHLTSKNSLFSCEQKEQLHELIAET